MLPAVKSPTQTYADNVSTTAAKRNSAAPIGACHRAAVCDQAGRKIASSTLWMVTAAVKSHANRLKLMPYRSIFPEPYANRPSAAKSRSIGAAEEAAPGIHFALIKLLG